VIPTRIDLIPPADAAPLKDPAGAPDAASSSTPEGFPDPYALLALLFPVPTAAEAGAPGAGQADFWQGLGARYRAKRSLQGLLRQPTKISPCLSGLSLDYHSPECSHSSSRRQSTWPTPQWSV